MAKCLQSSALLWQSSKFSLGWDRGIGVLDGKSLLNNNEFGESAMATFNPYDIGCEPSPSVPCETLLQDSWDTFLLFYSFDSVSEVIVLECENCVSSRFGYPNDEGWPEHPHYRDGISTSRAAIFVSDNSPWLSDISTQMRKSSLRIWGGRGMTVLKKPQKQFHFIAPMKETTFECIASGLKVAHRAVGFDEAFAYVRHRFSQH